jgi:hypothetical protein
MPGSVHDKQQAAVGRPYSASRQGSRPSSSAGRPSSRQQQQPQQQEHSWSTSQGVLAQDPVPAAARLGAAYLRNGNNSSSVNMSRPGSAAKQPATATVGAAELRSPSRQQQSYRQRQQSAVGTAAAAATPLSSVLAATPRNRPRSTSSQRPSSASARPGSQQRQAAAQGPLLSEYFRPPSAAAPGSISMFGLPGMEPPGGLANAVPSVKVPSVHASWDAAVGGLLSASSSSSSCAVGSSPKASGAAAAAAAGGQVSAAAAGGVQQQQQQKQQVRPGTTPAAIAAGELHSGYSPACIAARPDSSRHTKRPGSAAVVNSAAGEACAQQLLLWSAAHEIDGRPVTRNGERAR